MTRRQFLKRSALTTAASIIGIGGYTWRWEPHWVEFVERPLPIANLPSSLAGKRLVQLTDLHIGPRVSDSFLIETFKQISSLAPDFVVYTGDFTSFELNLFSRVEKVFKHLPTGRIGSFGVLGNHDYGIAWRQAAVADRLAAMAEAAGVKILRNAAAEAGGLQFIGLDDLWAKQFHPENILPSATLTKPTVILSHNPDTADLPKWDGYGGWILCGHTHGGQCKPPFLPPPLLPVVNRNYTSGTFDLPGNRKMYISRGLGHLLQVRFNVRPEVTVFTLERPIENHVLLEERPQLHSS